MEKCASDSAGGVVSVVTVVVVVKLVERQLLVAE